MSRYPILSILAIIIFVTPTAQAEEQDQLWTLHNAVGASDSLKLTGSTRLRLEGLQGQFRNNLSSSSAYVSIKSNIFAEYDFGPVRIGGEIIDSRAYATERGEGITSGIVNALEPVQAYVGFDFKVGDVTAKLDTGRFALNFGAQRLVGRTGFGNVINTFTGGHLILNKGQAQSLDLFYTLPNTRSPSDEISLLNNQVEFDDPKDNLQFWGAYYTNTNFIIDTQVEAFMLGLNEEDALNSPTRNRQLYTPGIRIVKNSQPNSFGYEFEGAYQFGTVRETKLSTSPLQDVSAGLVHAEVSYQFDHTWHPVVSFEYDYASGDRQGGYEGRFDNLFGLRRGDLGPTDIDGQIPRANISAPGVRFAAKPNSRLDGFLSYRAVWLAEKTDAFTAGIRDVTGSSGSFAGQQLEARARYWLKPSQIHLEMGGAYFINGNFLENAPNASGNGNTAFGYAGIMFKF